MDGGPEEWFRRRALTLDMALVEVAALIARERQDRSRTLDLSFFTIAELPHELGDLTWLKSLDCSGTLVTDLTPLSGLGALTQLDCSWTQVADLTPLSGLGALTDLSCFGTQVRDLSPLSGLGGLTQLSCYDAPVSDLSPIKAMPSLKILVCHDLPQCPVPAEVLSQHHGDNCLPRLRSYWANEAAGSEPFRQHKLFLLGNGTVGKTQVARRLMGLGFDAAIPSTHGIQLHAHPLPAWPDSRDERAGETFDARIWDFGGQDIYHGTHALFLKSRAVFLICWEAESEQARHHTIDGQDYRNRPLAYWLDYVRNLAGPGAQVILVQTQCDRPGAPLAPPIDLSPWRDLEGLDICRTSALRGSGFADLKEKIADAVARLEAPALHRIGTCERRVIDAIAGPRAKGTRTLDQTAFAAICAEADVQGLPEHLLHFLHHAGELFQLGDQIIVDQRWALDAIYTVFNREECWQAIRANRGRFTLPDLAQGVWRDHGQEERGHFLAMMLKCGMAFEYIEEDEGWHDAIYIAPDLLPERGDPFVAKLIARDWDEGGGAVRRAVAFPLLHDGLMREIMSGIGKDAGLHAVYWKNGLLFWDGRTKAVAMIEAHWPDPEGWAGEIVISAQRSRAAELAEVMERHVRTVAQRIGLAATPGKPDGPPDASDAFSRAAGHGARADDNADPGFTAAEGQPLRPTCYVSYAWSDKSEQADANEALVDEFCEEAERRGMEVCRDKTHQRDGDWIGDFIEDVKRADRVFAMIGGRYWTRPCCMAELHGIWRRCESDPEIFKERVRDYLFEDSGVSQPEFLKVLHAKWRAELKRLGREEFKDLSADQQLVVVEGEEWIGAAPGIVNAMKKKFRSYQGDFDAYTRLMLDELEGMRYHAPEG